MSKAGDRMDIVRIDCPTCGGAGFIYGGPDGQSPCARCAGVGMLEKSVPYNGGATRSKAELRQIFGVENPTNISLGED